MSIRTQDVLWAREMLSELRFEQKNPTVAWEDNQGALALSTNPGYHTRTKHVNIRYHFIREKITTGLIKVIYKEMKYQLADILTKALGTKRVKVIRDEMGIN